MVSQYKHKQSYLFLLDYLIKHGTISPNTGEPGLNTQIEMVQIELPIATRTTESRITAIPVTKVVKVLPETPFHSLL